MINTVPAKKRILVVDDEEDIAQIMAYRLCLIGDYDVDVSYDGFDAAKKVKTNKYDLIFLDIMMPGIDGLKVCRLLKKDPSTASIPVIIFSALSDSKIIVEAINAGAKDYIVKPFDIHTVQKKVDLILNEERSEQTPEADSPVDPSIPDNNKLRRKLKKNIFSKLNKVEPFNLIPDILISTQGNPKTLSDNLKSIIYADIGFSLNILMIANSVFYCPVNTVTNVSRAISAIGTTTIISKIKEMVMNKQIVGDNVRAILKDGFMVSYMARAFAAQFIAEKESFVSPEDAFCFAVLRDIGKYLLLNLDPDEFTKIIEETRSSGKKISELEKRYIGKTSMELAYELMQKWGFPKTYREFFAQYCPGKETNSLYTNKLFEIVELADFLIKISGFAYFDNTAIPSIPFFMEPRYQGFLKYSSSAVKYVKKHLTSVNCDFELCLKNNSYSDLSSLRFCIIAGRPHYIIWKLVIESLGANTIVLNWDEADSLNTLNFDYFIADIADIGKNIFDFLSNRKYVQQGIIFGKNVNALKKLIKTFPNANFKKNPFSREEFFYEIDKLIQTDC